MNLVPDFLNQTQTGNFYFLQNINLSPENLWIGYGVFVLLVVIMSVVLVFHWRAYAMAHHKHLVVTEWVYLLVALFLLMISSSSLIIYSL